MEKQTVSANQNKQMRRAQPMMSAKDMESPLQTKRRDHHPPTQVSGRAVDTPDGTIEEVPEEQAP